MKKLEAGKDYTYLKRSYIIMITTFDPFDKNRMVYSMKTQCLEEPGLAYDDGA